MRILALYPAFDVRINEMAMLWERLCATREAECTVLAGAQDILKAHEAAETVESYGRLTVERFPRLRATADILERGCACKPEVIYCAVTENIPLAKALHERTGAPIVLHNEYFLDDLTFLRKRYHAGIPAVRSAASRIGRAYLHGTCSVVIISNPVEQRSPSWQQYPRLRYLPWPHPDPGPSAARNERDLNFSAYIGSMSRGKGAGHLLAAYSALLQALPEFRIQLVGPAVDEEGRQAVETLKGKFPDRVTVLLRCSREEAMALLRRSLFVFSPARRYGWGLIGDAWGTGTPVISIVEHYDLVDGRNCLVAADAASFVKHVTALRDDAALFERITAGGRTTVQGHSLDAAAGVLWTHLQSATHT